MTAEEILAQAAELVERPDGWCQHRLFDSNGRVCLLGALFVAGGMMSLQGRATASFGDAVDARLDARKAVDRELRSTDNYSLVDWNNAHGRTKEEVAATLRNAKRWLAP